MEYAERFAWFNFDYKNAPGYTKKCFNELRKKEDLDNIKKCFYISYSHKKEELFELIKDIPLDWIHAYSLTNNKQTYYPINWLNNYQTSNGLASGNIKEEAILHAICEVIERHNISNFLLNLKDIPKKLIDINSLDDDLLKNLINSYNKNNIDIHLINATNDFNIPTIMACGIDKKPPMEWLRVGYGFGCHTNPQKAITRALTEFAQCREDVIKQNEIPKELQSDKGHWQFKLSIDIDKILNESKKIDYKDLPNLSDDDIKTEVLRLVDLISNKGFEIILANKTHPKLNIPVYRIFIPGILPGTTIVSSNENDDLLVTMTYYQGGQIDKAKQY